MTCWFSVGSAGMRAWLSGPPGWPLLRLAANQAVLDVRVTAPISSEPPPVTSLARIIKAPSKLDVERLPAEVCPESASYATLKRARSTPNQGGANHWPPLRQGIDETSRRSRNACHPDQRPAARTGSKIRPQSGFRNDRSSVRGNAKVVLFDEQFLKPAELDPG